MSAGTINDKLKLCRYLEQSQLMGEKTPVMVQQLTDEVLAELEGLLDAAVWAVRRDEINAARDLAGRGEKHVT